jgi:hypothetical protein
MFLWRNVSLMQIITAGVLTKPELPEFEKLHPGDQWKTASGVDVTVLYHSTYRLGVWKACGCGVGVECKCRLPSVDKCCRHDFLCPLKSGHLKDDYLHGVNTQKLAYLRTCLEQTEKEKSSLDERPAEDDDAELAENDISVDSKGAEDDDVSEESSLDERPAEDDDAELAVGSKGAEDDVSEENVPQTDVSEEDVSEEDAAQDGAAQTEHEACLDEIISKMECLRYVIDQQKVLISKQLIEVGRTARAYKKAVDAAWQIEAELATDAAIGYISPNPKPNIDVDYAKFEMDAAAERFHALKVVLAMNRSDFEALLKRCRELVGFE